ncbi:MAG: hypothetical protein ACRCSN_04305 [Dermatophilaceae bacterium]
MDEDFYGLWEIGWRLNTAIGVDPASDPQESAAVVKSLRQRRLVDLYVRERIDDTPRQIEVSGRSIDLATHAAWLVPNEGEPQFLLGSWIDD